VIALTAATLESKQPQAPPGEVPIHHEASRFARAVSLGFIEDRYGHKRKVSWPVFLTLGVALPGLAMFAIVMIVIRAFQAAFANPTGFAYWAQVDWPLAVIAGVALNVFALIALFRVVRRAAHIVFEMDQYDWAKALFFSFVSLTIVASTGPAVMAALPYATIEIVHDAGLIWDGAKQFATWVYLVSTAFVPLSIILFSWVMLKVTNRAITIYYHRGLTHKGLRFPKGTEFVLNCLSSMAWQGDADDWVTDHRRHHAKSDIVGLDPHSPWEYPGWRGVIWAQGVWLFFKIDRPPKDRRAKDLKYNPIIQWQDRWGFALFAILSLAIPLLFGAWMGWLAGGWYNVIVYALKGLLIAGILRLAVHLTVTGFINSVCHMWGKRARDSLGREYVSDDSRNNWFVAFITDGEGNHAGHHADPESPHHGWTAELDEQAIIDGAKPDDSYKPDSTWWTIKFMAKLRLLTIMHEPPKKVYFNDRKLVPNPSLWKIHRADSTVSRAGRRARLLDLERPMRPAGVEEEREFELVDTAA
jgi:stearoyl-CoA desaturase (delta-9 desaturase)